jgi:hypothetical protein
MSGILEFVKELFSQFASGAGSFIDIANAQRGWGIGLFFLILVWLLSGFASFEFANTTGMNGKKHFWIGLILPVIYPLFLLIRKLVIRAKAVSEAKRASERLAAERDQIEAERRRIDSTPNKDNFAKLKGSSDASSIKAQFRLELADGSTLMVAKILEAQDALAVCELESNEGETPRVLRMPYAKMSRIERL